MHVESTGFRGFAAQNVLLCCPCSTPRWDHRHHRAQHVYMLTSQLMWGASESLAHGSSGRTMDMMLRRGGGGGFCEQQGRRKRKIVIFRKKSRKKKWTDSSVAPRAFYAKILRNIVGRFRHSLASMWDGAAVLSSVCGGVWSEYIGGGVALAITSREIPVFPECLASWVSRDLLRP